MSARVEWADEALRNLADIEEYIARDNPVAAKRWVTRLIERASRVAHMPHASRLVPEYQHKPWIALREVLMRRYRILFVVLEGGVGIRVVFVTQGSRPLPEEPPAFEEDQT